MGVKWEEAEFLADALCCKRFIKGLQNPVMGRGGGAPKTRSPAACFDASAWWRLNALRGQSG